MSTNHTNINKALLFIPDISGFTEFVHFTEVTHSKHIISELLEILIDANNTNMTLAEIEGDALFFYKETQNVNLEELKAQIAHMYIKFHTHLKRYEYERICQCGACSSAYNLKLKVVTHFGVIDFIKVKDNVKPYGSNVIQVHRLLKNKIPETEYALYTNSIIGDNTKENVVPLTETYDFGQVQFGYQPLVDLKDQIPYVPPIPQDTPKHKLFHVEQIIEAPVLDLYELISNFDYRLLWTKGVDGFSYEKNKINRAGTKHQCLFDNQNSIDQTTITKKVGPDQLVYGESTNQLPFTKKVNLYYVLEEVEPGKTKVEVEAFADFKFLGIFMKPLLSKKFKNNIVENLKELILLLKSGFTFENHLTNNENA